MQVLFQKMPGGYLAPLGEDAERFVAGLKQGAGIRLDVTKARNIRFHKKALKLLRVGFDVWEPDGLLIDGIVPCKDFDSFREKVLILAGHADVTYGLDGQVSFKARSIAFANCDELEFQKVYSRMLDVIWERVMRHANYRSPAELDAVVNELLKFS